LACKTDWKQFFRSSK